MQQLLREWDLYQVHLELGFFGAPTAKGIELLSNTKYIGELPDMYTYDVRPESKGKRITHKDEKGRVSGGAGLKETQAYPVDFGIAVRDMYVRHEAEFRSDAKARMMAASGGPTNLSLHDILSFNGVQDWWDDAELGSVVSVLQRLAAQNRR